MSTQKEETRLRLLDAARTLLVQRGFHRVGLEDIAAAAGVSRQAVYKSHFASKADLLLELARHVDVAENLEELIRPIAEAESGPGMLERAIAATVWIEVRVHDIALVLSTAALSDEGASVAWRSRLELKRGGLRKAVVRTRDEGLLSPGWQVEEAVDLLSTLLSVDAYQQLVVDQGWKPEQLIRRVWEISERSLLAPPLKKPTKTKK